jgi:hypothetical protein
MLVDLGAEDQAEATATEAAEVLQTLILAEEATVEVVAETITITPEVEVEQ